MKDATRFEKYSAALLERIGYRFVDRELLVQALTHKSYSNEQLEVAEPHNERLEFLGDAVLDMVVSHKIFIAYPELPEGELTRIRAEVVSESGLAVVARELNIGRCLRLGRGEIRTGGWDKDSLIADALEALIGAIYCDGGPEPVRAMIDLLFDEAIAQAYRHKAGIDFKTRLQELLQSRYGSPPDYQLLHAEGPDHLRTYTIAVRHAGAVIGHGSGRTKKAAAQQAARQALATLED